MVCMPYGYVCPVGMYALWVCMPYGYVCPVGTNGVPQRKSVVLLAEVL